MEPFSILKRIVMGETSGGVGARPRVFSFSILKRIVMGETYSLVRKRPPRARSFSILKRIVMGETNAANTYPIIHIHFQYPQADRDG